MAAVLVLALLALAAATVVIVYAAYPYRGQETPVAPQVGRAMRRGVEALPTVDPDEAHAQSQGRTHDEELASR